MMIRRVFYGLLFLLLFVLTSCRQKAESLPEPSIVESIPAETYKITSESTVDRLRVRSLPYLDGEVVAFLSAGELVVVESRTEWTQELDEISASWFFVRTEVASGWAYGGFLRFPDDNENLVPVNPALPEPKAASVQETEGPINVADLPEILLPVFGIEAEPPQLPGGEGTIGYDPVHEYLIIPYLDKENSLLASVARGESNLRLVAENVGGLRFERELALEDLSLYSSAFTYTGTEGEALLVPFFRLAYLREGAWEFYAFAGEESWPAAIGRADISPVVVSVVTSDEPDPLRDSPHQQFNRGDTAFCYGADGPAGEYLQVALYHDTGEYKDSMILLRPELGRRVKVDSRGSWSTHFSLGQDMPSGRYWVAIGNPIEGLDDVKLFITSLEIMP